MQSNIWIFIVYFSTEGQGGGPKYEKIQAWLNPAKGRVQGGGVRVRYEGIRQFFSR